MTAVDTNILVRFLVKDDKAQYESGLEFADALHLASSRGADKFMSFDKSLVKKAGKLTHLAVEIPK
ncbi:MAG TPA: hypothetical protein DET40_13445 [Lentisphaeria bacterium]|nr:MAG: hypothetical protein A2X45_22790 [Lentisphaerae bacterium GWF2_50_93]HCE44545.1 hypothetical protein [Lentisphaeria bacterium]